MLRITFKYVGQGDCILIEWVRAGQKKIGVVDCNAQGHANAVISHLQATGYDSIEFVVLSHPDRDHFSGIPALFRYCHERNIAVRKFIHTCRNVRDYLKSLFIVSREEKRSLDQVFVTAKMLRDKGLLDARDQFDVNPHFQTELASGVYMRFLAPSTDEYEAFATSLYLDDDLNLGKNRPNNNLLSTVIILETQHWYVLLTSDTERAVLKRVGLKDLRHDYRQMKLGQVPHHGSKNNYSSGFWKNRRHDPMAPVAISVGPPNVAYKHPSPDVIRALRALQFKVYTTFVEATGPVVNPGMGLALDVISKVRPSSEAYGRDLVFDILP